MSASRSVRSLPKFTYSDTMRIPFASATSGGKYAVVSETTATRGILGGAYSQPAVVDWRRMPDYDAKQVEDRLEERLREIAVRREELHRKGEGMGDERADYAQHPADQGAGPCRQEPPQTTRHTPPAEER